MRRLILGSIIAATMLSPAMAEEICGGSLEGVLLCEPGKPWDRAPEPWQWLMPFSKKTDINGVPLTPFDRGDAANQLVGVITDIMVMAQHCPSIKLNFALIRSMMLTLGVRQADIDAGKYNEEIRYMGSEEQFNDYTGADGRKWGGRILNQGEIAVNVDRWCHNIAEASFAEDGMYHGLATIKQRTR
jgi:hypothetical protein